MSAESLIANLLQPGRSDDPTAAVAPTSEPRYQDAAGLDRPRIRRLLAVVPAVLTILAASSGATSSGVAAKPEPPHGRPPNVVLLIADDYDYELFGFAGHPAAHTPTIDRLAAEGFVFSTAHVPMSRCRPSLTSLLTDRWPHQHGIYYNHNRAARPAPLEAADTLTSRLAAAGWATFGDGKLWFDDPAALGFTHAARGGVTSFVREGQGRLFEFLDGVGDRPFFVWWAPALPHTPHDPPLEHLEAIDRLAISLPGHFDAEHSRYLRFREHLSLAMGAWLDEGVAELLAGLEARGLAERTILVFLIDNGWANGVVSKGSPREKGLRTPIVVHAPGLVGAGGSDDLVSSLDVAPTLLDYLGLEVPASWVGRSLRPVIEGAAGTEQRSGPDIGAGHASGRDALFGAIYPALAGPERRPELDVYALYRRDRRWKYVLYTREVDEGSEESLRITAIGADYPSHRPGDEELFDLLADPYEQRDLAALPEHRQRLDEMREQLLAWWSDTGGRPIPGTETAPPAGPAGSPMPGGKVDGRGRGQHTGPAPRPEDHR